ncbi:MAG: peptidylprolyl isomerase [Deltaproteobacteria bacterium]|nr:peptidylprolyl isomerase [Deltaproteobacteria bacterium]
MKTKLIYLIAIIPLLLSCKGNPQKTDAADTPKAAAAFPKECPGTYTVKLETTKGDILIDVTKAWAPLGAQRFWELVTTGYYTDVAFFRVIEDFIAQAGIHGNPDMNKLWREKKIQDDPVKQGNEPGTVVFAMGGPNTRTTQFFINFKNNSQLDGMGFAAFGKVRDMSVVKKIYSGYGEGAPRGRGPSQMLMQTKGNDYLKSSFPQLDYIKSAVIVTQ